MADGLRAELIYRDFNRMLEELAAIDPRIEFSDVTRSEAASVTSGAMSRTRAATVSGIQARQNGKKVQTFGGKSYFLENRFPDQIWNEIQRLRGESLKTKLGARGLAKQSWHNLAAKMGRTITTPAYVTNANFRGRQYSENVETYDAGNLEEFILTIENNSPLGEGARMESAFLSAMNGRTRYFERNMENRAFRSLADRAKKYPGIFTDPVPPPAD